MSEKKKKRLILLDSHAIIHRAYHALPDFATSKGEPTGALYGLSTMLIKIIADLKPDYIVACYDLPKPTYRHEAYEGYKSGRAKTDDALVEQLKRSREIFEAFGIPMYDKEGFEADDMLGTIVAQVESRKSKVKSGEEIDVVIASGDMDTLQLVDGKKVQVYTLKKGINDTILYDEERVIERYGFKPKMLVDYKGLRGDPSDNIIGIPGIGEKTATELIQKFGTIEEIYKKLKVESEKFKEEGIKPRIIELLKEHEEEALFSKMLASIRRDAPIDFSIPEKTWRDGLDMEKVTNLFSNLEFRTLANRFKESLGIEDKDEEGKPRQASLNEAGGEKIDEAELKEAQTALWLINSSMTNPTLDDVLNFARTKSFKKAKEEVLKELKAKNLERVFETIEKPLIPVVSSMNERGISVDIKYLTGLSKEYHKELSKLQEEIWKMAEPFTEGGEREFNINSPKQLGEILFVKMGLKAKNQKKTGTGALSTKESELEKLREENPIVDRILKYREFQKLLSTYIDSIPAMVDKKGRLHATFLQSGTTTGRMGCENPNLQNIPVKTDLGRRIRNAFVADEGYNLLAIDYSQIELRISAFLSGDKKLLDVFRSGGDIHTAVASEVFGVEPDKVDREMRRQAKVINFGIIYGMGVNALRANLGTTREEAQKFYNEYFNKFKTLAKYLDGVKISATETGFTETFFGRRRYFEGLKSKLPFIRASAERMAINAPIQGTGADITKLAMVKVDEYIKREGLEKKVFLVLQVHDELVYEVKSDIVKKVAPKIKAIMESVMTLEETSGVRILTESKVGANWGEMKEVESSK